jgi:hypothetical protein
MKREMWEPLALALFVWGLISCSARPSGQAPTTATTTTEIESMTPLERNCYDLWRKYNNISNRTIQETAGIQSCESLGLFHDR